MSNDELAGRAALAIKRAEEAGYEYARLCALEMDLEADRPAQKADAIRRIMASGPNPLSATGKEHSASSAEAIVETDHAYRAYLRQQSEVVQQKNEAFARSRSAQLMAELAIAQLRGLPALQEVG